MSYIPKKVLDQLKAWSDPGTFTFSTARAKELYELLAAQDDGTTDVNDFLAEVRAELVKARKKHPNTLVTTLGMAEESGELVKAVLDEEPDRIRKEAVQVAAMAARVVLDGDQSVERWRTLHKLTPDIRT